MTSGGTLKGSLENQKKFDWKKILRFIDKKNRDKVQKKLFFIFAIKKFDLHFDLNRVTVRYKGVEGGPKIGIFALRNM